MVALDFFISEKKSLLNKVKKRSWRNAEQMKEIFDKLAEKELKIGDVVWMLSDSDRMVRTHATEIIVEQQLEGAAGALLNELQGASGAARNYLISIIPRLNDKSIFDRLETMMSARDARQRASALDIVLAFDSTYVQKFLIKMLEHEDRDYRFRSLQKLVSNISPETGPDSALKEHVILMLEDSDERIRITCVEVLQKNPDSKVVEVFLDRFVRDEYNVQTAIIKALEKCMAVPELKMVERLLPLLSQGDDMIRSTALTLLVKTGDPIDIIRRILLMSQELMGWMRERILRTIRASDADLVPAIAELLDHADEEVRSKALMFATDFDNEILVEPVVRLLRREKDWWLRIIAMDFLGRLGDDRGVEPLIECLENDEVRWSAVEALTRIKSPKALEPIARLLSDPSPEVRLQVISSLELYNHVKALPLLQKVMKGDGNVEIRERALSAYKAICEKNDQDINEKELRASFGYTKSAKPVDKLLTETRRVGASDLHITPEAQPVLRLNGVLKKIGSRTFDASHTRKMILQMLTAEQRERFDEEHQLDFCYELPGVGRYRTNVYEERLGTAGVFRVIPNELPTFLDCGLPQNLIDIVNYHQGLILVTGPAGSGKSTTLAALINLINEQKRHHILTLEDPIEFVHPYKNSLVNQREIGKHSKTFASSLRAALREDPDVIVVGELRDQETMMLAMEAAETGHVVISTMNTTSAVKTVNRLVDAFPPKEQAAVRMSLSEALKIVTSQTLLPRADKKGRVAVHEVLMVTGPVSNLIRDNKTGMIPSAMTTGKSHGMQTVDMALENLLDKKLINPEDAYLRAENKDLFEPLVSREFLEGQDPA